MLSTVETIAVTHIKFLRFGESLSKSRQQIVFALLVPSCQQV